MERKILQDRKGFSNSLKFIVAQKKGERGKKRREEKLASISKKKEKRKEKPKRKEETEIRRGKGRRKMR